MNRITCRILVVAALTLANAAHAAEALLPVETTDLSSVSGLDRDVTVDASMADDFAREALQEPSDRPILEQQLVARTFEGRPQLFWKVRLAGSWKVALVHANGECEGSTIVEDIRPKSAAALVQQ